MNVSAWRDTARALLILLLVSSPTLAGVHPLAGQVVDDTTGAPVRRARVEIINSAIATITDDEGRFAIDEVPDGATTLRSVAPGYEVGLVHIEDARDGSRLNVRLRPCLRYDEAVVVTAHREETDVRRVPRTMSVRTSQELQDLMPRTTPEALMDLPGLLVQKTNHGGGSPYIRGLVGNHVLVLVDGVRLNNATFRYGPNQYLATVDPDQIDRVEVLRGSGSVLYGSDAIGGVINIITKRPALSGDGAALSGQFAGKLVSSGMERSGRLEVAAGGSRAAILGGISARDFGDVHAGGALGVEAPSGYWELNADAHAVVRLSSRNLLTAAFQQVHQDDVPRFDQVAQRGFLRYSFDPQIRRLAYARWQAFTSNVWARSITATGSIHQSVERRDRQRRDSATRILERDDVSVLGASFEVRSAPTHSWSIVSGFDYTHDKVGSWRSDSDVVTGVTVAKRGLYPDGATASSAAVFTHNSLQLGRTTVDGGFRFSLYGVNAADATFGALRLRTHGLVGSLAAAHEITDGVSMIGSISQGFRAPNIDDVSTLGAFDFGVEVPSPDLSPERSLSFEAGTRLTWTRVGTTLVAFRTDLSDLIDRVRSELDGVEFWEGQRVYRRANVGEAYVTGVEVESRWQVIPRLAVFGHAMYTYGQQTTTDQPMRRIPPLNGLVGARYGLTEHRRSWIEGTLRLAARQDRLAPGDIDDHRIPAGGTPGWVVLNVNAGVSLGKLELIGGVYNCFDEDYRIHGSGIDGYGRAVWLGTRVSIR